ncbi:hypothetical protein Q6A49_12605 [Pseudomonas sp. 22-AL-CL-001]|uniref:hypothetical protein n=1 Tax=Pseudomonas alabamensis TaxID=3064349 RepID=UPI002713EBFC|nr:hypothetical protein [Pseudomonas sp. 22-AL-CL-001]MDO7911374.1 hypothetical protein [Pseudomonas sp. 22-AL-CL-001]
MTEQANRIDWLERQLAQVNQFIERDARDLESNPGRYSLQIALNSWRSHQEELHQELRQAKANLQFEVVQLRLIGMRMDGSIPLKLLSKLSDSFNRALSYAAYHLRHGSNPKRGIPESLAKELDLRLSDLAFGSTRLVFAGNVAPDTTGESIMEGALEQIFDVLGAPTHDRIKELVSVIGVPATKALSDMLGVLETSQIGAELSWPAPNAKVYRWGGTLDAVRLTHDRLSVHQDINPQPTTLFGVVADLKENGTIYIRNGNSKQKVTYNRQQFPEIQKLSLGMPISIKVMKYVRYVALEDKEIVTYKMITDD